MSALPKEQNSITLQPTTAQYSVRKYAVSSNKIARTRSSLPDQSRGATWVLDERAISRETYADVRWYRDSLLALIDTRVHGVGKGKIEAALTSTNQGERGDAIVNQYILAALNHSVPEFLDEDGVWYAEVPELRGVWASSDSESTLTSELAAAVKGWLEVRLARGHAIPVLDGIDLNASPAV